MKLAPIQIIGIGVSIWGELFRLWLPILQPTLFEFVERIEDAIREQEEELALYEYNPEIEGEA